MIKLSGWMLLLSAAMLFCAPAHADDDDDCEREKAVAFPFVEPQVKGVGKLCESARGLRSVLRMRDLIPGNAYTVWWTYIDDPRECEGDTTETGGASITGGESECEVGDFIGENFDGKPPGIFGRMASGIAPRSGRLVFRGSWGGMQPSEGAEVWFWLFTHLGAKLDDGDALARQLLTPEDPNAGAPHLGIVDDGQLGFPAATVVFTIGADDDEEDDD